MGEASGLMIECSFCSADASAFRNLFSRGRWFSLFAENMSDARNEISVRVCVYPESERPQPRTHVTLKKVGYLVVSKAR